MSQTAQVVTGVTAAVFTVPSVEKKVATAYEEAVGEGSTGLVAGDLDGAVTKAKNAKAALSCVPKQETQNLNNSIEKGSSLANAYAKRVDKNTDSTNKAAGTSIAGTRAVAAVKSLGDAAQGTLTRNTVEKEAERSIQGLEHAVERAKESAGRSAV